MRLTSCPKLLIDFEKDEAQSKGNRSTTQPATYPNLENSGFRRCGSPDRKNLTAVQAFSKYLSSRGSRPRKGGVDAFCSLFCTMTLSVISADPLISFLHQDLQFPPPLRIQTTTWKTANPKPTQSNSMKKAIISPMNTSIVPRVFDCYLKSQNENRLLASVVS